MNMATMYWLYSEINNMSTFSNFYTPYNSTYIPFIVAYQNSFKMANILAESAQNQTFG